jgi:hypothetical protein
MKPGNFNWFLHTMLFYHTKHVITQQKQKAKAKAKKEKAKATSQNRNNEDEDEDLGLDQENNFSDLD